VVKKIKYRYKQIKKFWYFKIHFVWWCKLQNYEEDAKTRQVAKARKRLKQMSCQYELVHWFHRVGLHDANQKCYWFQTSSNSLMEMGLHVFLLSGCFALVSSRFRRFHKLWRLERIARILIKNSHFQSQYRRKHTFQAQPIAGFSFIETHNAENFLFVRIRMRQSQNKFCHLWKLFEFRCLCNTAF